MYLVWVGARGCSRCPSRVRGMAGVSWTLRYRRTSDGMKRYTSMGEEKTRPWRIWTSTYELSHLMQCDLFTAYGHCSSVPGLVDIAHQAPTPTWVGAFTCRLTTDSPSESPAAVQWAQARCMRCARLPPCWTTARHPLLWTLCWRSSRRWGPMIKYHSRWGLMLRSWIAGDGPPGWAAASEVVGAVQTCRDGMDELHR